MSLMLIVDFLLPASPADDTKDAKDKDTPPKKTTKASDKEKPTYYKEKSAKAGEPFVGKLIQVEGAQRYLTVQVTLKIPQENTGAAQSIANLQRQLVGNRDPNSIRSIALQLAQQRQNLVTYKDQTKNLELSAGDDMKVRSMLPPVEYDDKGKLKKLTPKELKALQGDPKLPGFPADFDSLKPNQTVKVYLAKTKDTGKAKVKDKDLLADSKEKQKVTMIVIVSEPVK
jgi:hypothetical protein